MRKCVLHRFTNHGATNSLSSLGRIKKVQCNNCLAVKITHEWSTWPNAPVFDRMINHVAITLIEDPREK
jgi:hypothetical protein